MAHHVARAKPGRVAKMVLIGAVPPIMVKSDKNPGGLQIEVFDGFRAALAANRAQFVLDVPSGPFYGFNRPGAAVSEGVIRNWWRQGMIGGAKAHDDSIKAFSETDFTDDLKAIQVQTTKSCPTPIRRRPRSSCSRTRHSRPTKTSRTACARRMRT